MREVTYIPRGMALDVCYNVMNGNKIPTVRAVIDGLKKLDVITAQVPSKWEDGEEGFVCGNCRCVQAARTKYCPECGTMMKDMAKEEEA